MQLRPQVCPRFRGRWRCSRVAVWITLWVGSWRPAAAGFVVGGAKVAGGGMPAASCRTLQRRRRSRSCQVGAGRPAGAVQQLGLQGGEEALRDAVIQSPTLPPSSRGTRRCGAVRAAGRLVANGGAGAGGHYPASLCPASWPGSVAIPFRGKSRRPGPVCRARRSTGYPATRRT